METNQNQFEKYLRAKKQVEEIRGFYSHLLSFIIVNLLLLTINLIYSPERLWFYWTTMGWGIGVFFHGLKAFNETPFLGKDWEEKKMRQFMEEEKYKNNKFE